jgi:hypothetical protein
MTLLLFIASDALRASGNSHLPGREKVREETGEVQRPIAGSST